MRKPAKKTIGYANIMIADQVKNRMGYSIAELKAIMGRKSAPSKMKREMLRALGVNIND